MQVSIYPKFYPLESQLCLYITSFDIFSRGPDFENCNGPGRAGPGPKKQARIQLDDETKY